MFASKAIFLAAVAVAVVAAQQQQQQQPQDRGQLGGQPSRPAAPVKCDLPFGNDAFLSNGTESPARVTVHVKQVGTVAAGDTLKKLRGGQLLVTIDFELKPGAKAIAGTAIRPGLPWPVGEWDATLVGSIPGVETQIIDCLHPNSHDTLLVTGAVPSRVQWRLTPYLAAWNNQATRNVTFEAGFANTDGEIWIQIIPIEVAISERSYTVPRELLPPPPPTPEQLQRVREQQQQKQQAQQQQQQQQQFGGQPTSRNF